MNTTARDYHNTIDSWMQTLERHDIGRLLAQPAPGVWSLGQVCVHILDEADFQFRQIQTCLTCNENATEVCSEEAVEMFRRNAFPDVRIAGPDSNAWVPQPDSKRLLLDRLSLLKDRVNDTDRLIAGSLFYGKTCHPGLLYLDAAQWFQFSEMHFRHHLRQKDRIEAFLERTFGKCPA